MIVTFLPTKTVSYCIIGITPSDMELMNQGVEPNVIDLKAGFPHGIALPSYVQMVFVKDEVEFTARINAALSGATGQKFDGELVTIENPLEDDDG